MSTYTRLVNGKYIHTTKRMHELLDLYMEKEMPRFAYANIICGEGDSEQEAIYNFNTHPIVELSNSLFAPSQDA